METIVVMMLVAVIFAPLWFVTVCVWVCMFVTTVVVAVDTSTKWWLPGPRKNNECARAAGPHLHNKHTGSTTLFPSSGTTQSREQNKTTQRKRKRNKKSASRVSVCVFVFLCVSVCVCVQMITTGTCGKSGFGVLLARRVAATVVAFALAQGARVVRHHAHLTGQTADVAALAAIFWKERKKERGNGS